VHCAHVVDFEVGYNMCTVHVLFSHNEITTFWSTQNDHSFHKTSFLWLKNGKNSFAAGALTRTPLEKLTSGTLRRGGKGKEGKSSGKKGTMRSDCSVRNFLLQKLV